MYIVGLPNLADCVDDSMQHELKKAANIFNLPYLTQVVDNIKNDSDPWMNPSIGTYLTDRLGHRFNLLFLGKKTFSDVKLNIKGELLIGLL